MIKAERTVNRVQFLDQQTKGPVGWIDLKGISVLLMLFSASNIKRLFNGKHLVTGWKGDPSKKILEANN